MVSKNKPTYIVILEQYNYSWALIKQRINLLMDNGLSYNEVAQDFGYKNKKSFDVCMKRLGYYLFEPPERMLKRALNCKKIIKDNGGEKAFLRELKERYKRNRNIIIMAQLLGLDHSILCLIIYQLDREFIKQVIIDYANINSDY